MDRKSRTFVEPLEPRQFFSIFIGPGHVLNVHGVANQPNTISVGLVPGGQSVFAQISYPTSTGVHTESAIYSLRKIRLLLLNGGDKSDHITIDQTNGSLPIRAVINTHNGNDVVSAGDEPDKIILGNGIDVVASGNGNDTIYAGGGPETLSGGSGNDIFHGGRGHDDITAGAGSNVLVDPFGHDTLLAGGGHDVFIVKNIRLDPTNNYDPKKDKLRKYVPPATNSNSSSITNTVLNNLLDSFLF